MSLTKKQFQEKIKELEELLNFEYEICKEITRDFLESELQNRLSFFPPENLEDLNGYDEEKDYEIEFHEIKIELEDLSEENQIKINDFKNENNDFTIETYSSSIEYPFYGDFLRKWIKVTYSSGKKSFVGVLYDINGDEITDRCSTSMSNGW